MLGCKKMEKREIISKLRCETDGSYSVERHQSWKATLLPIIGLKLVALSLILISGGHKEWSSIGSTTPSQTT